MNETPATPAPSRSFWHRRLVGPLRTQLTQGTTPDRLAFTVGIGAACSVIPFFGFTAVTNLVVGFGLRLNQPLLQILNQLLGPVQLALILVYVRLGEKIWHATPTPLSVPVLINAFKEDPRGFLHRFGWTGIYAASAWALSAPLIIAGFYYALRPVMRRLAARSLPALR